MRCRGVCNPPVQGAGEEARAGPTPCAVLSVIIVLPHTLYAQGVGASGDIQGTVTDSSGAVTPRVNVAVTNSGKGIRRSVSTDGSGRYQITGLEPATYDVSVQMTGFATEIRKDV